MCPTLRTNREVHRVAAVPNHLAHICDAQKCTDDRSRDSPSGRAATLLRGHLSFLRANTKGVHATKQRVGYHCRRCVRDGRGGGRVDDRERRRPRRSVRGLEARQQERCSGSDVGIVLSIYGHGSHLRGAMSAAARVHARRDRHRSRGAALGRDHGLPVSSAVAGSSLLEVYQTFFFGRRTIEDA